MLKLLKMITNSYVTRVNNNLAAQLAIFSMTLSAIVNGNWEQKRMYLIKMEIRN